MPLIGSRGIGQRNVVGVNIPDLADGTSKALREEEGKRHSAVYAACVP